MNLLEDGDIFRAVDLNGEDKGAEWQQEEELQMHVRCSEAKDLPLMDIFHWSV